jgi:hypothetical protein
MSWSHYLYCLVTLPSSNLDHHRFDHVHIIIMVLIVVVLIFVLLIVIFVLLVVIFGCDLLDLLVP